MEYLQKICLVLGSKWGKIIFQLNGGNGSPTLISVGRSSVCPIPPYIRPLFVNTTVFSRSDVFERETMPRILHQVQHLPFVAKLCQGVSTDWKGGLYCTIQTILCRSLFLFPVLVKYFISPRLYEIIFMQNMNSLKKILLLVHGKDKRYYSNKNKIKVSL